MLHYIDSQLYMDMTDIDLVSNQASGRQAGQIEGGENHGAI